MLKWIKKALTRKLLVRGSRGRVYEVVEEPSDKLVLAVQFSIAMTACLTALEVVHMIIFRKFNTEIFSAITSLIGTVTGILIAKKA